MCIRFLIISLLISTDLLLQGCVSSTVKHESPSGFVALPATDKPGFSAYIRCNRTGKFGLRYSEPPMSGIADGCFVTNPKLLESENYSPIDGFRLVGMLIQDVAISRPYAEESSAVAVLTDTFWRNESNTECILGTHLKMEDAKLADGSYLNINDISRAGFANKQVSIAYFYKPHGKELGGNTEVLFKAGRTFNSIPAKFSSQTLPVLDMTLARNQSFSESNSASISDNWVTFTTDVSFKDTDSSTRQMTSMLYIKYPCDNRDVVEKPDAFRLRSIGENGQPMIEIVMSGLMPVDSEANDF